MDGPELVLGDAVRTAEVVGLSLLACFRRGLPALLKYAVDFFLGKDAVACHARLSAEAGSAPIRMIPMLQDDGCFRMTKCPSV